MPVGNKPVLFHAIESVVNAGISDIGIVVGQTKVEVKAAVGDGSRWGVKVTYIEQPEPLGLAHAVLISEGFIGKDRFVLFLGDNFLKGGIRSFVEDFENGAQGWGVGRSIFLLPPTSTGAARGRGRRGRGLLRTTCHYTQPGCGTWVTIAKALSPGHPYLAQAWVRAPRGRAALRLAFGVAPEDVADGRTVLVSRRWTRITVRWVPQLQVGSAEIDVQVNAAGAVTFDADQVSVTSPGGKLVQIPRLDIPDRYRLAARDGTGLPSQAPAACSSRIRSRSAFRACRMHRRS